MELSGYREKKCQNSSAFKDWNTEAYIWYYMEIGEERFTSERKESLSANDRKPPAYLLYMGVADATPAMGRSGRSGYNVQLGALRTIRTLQAGRGLK